MKQKMIYCIAAAGMAFAVLVGAARLAEAHAILVEATPKADSMVDGPDIDVKLRFNVRIDKSRSRLILVLPGDVKQNLEILEEKSPEMLSAKGSALKPGSYDLQWRVLAEDGHITTGEIPFNVRAR